MKAAKAKQIISFTIALLIGLLASSIGKAATATGYYRVEQKDGIWWFVAPDGKSFFSNGVNVITTGAAREKYNSNNPEYAAFRHYANTGSWIDKTLSRLRQWNFNTIGGWSNIELQKRGAMPYTVVLHLGGSKFVPWGDLFNDQMADAFNEAVRKEIGSLKDDPNLVGYFSDNELGWWDDTIFFHFLKQPENNATRRVLLKLLRDHYGNDFSRLRRDFDTGLAEKFDALELQSSLTLRPMGNGAEVIDKFVFMLAERYYQLVHNAIRRHDSNHLILGDRYPGWYPQSVARAAKAYVDVISTNYSADWTDGRISRFYLDTLYRLTGKPILVTEYYMCATENRSGNKNSSAGFPVVKTQRERAESFRTNLTALASLPYVVGAHWFQYFDEPTLGRSDGEDYNMGLVDINDVPYEELTSAATSLQPNQIHARAEKNATKSTFTIAKLPSAKGGEEKGLLSWNKELSFVKSINAEKNFPFADLYACWDKNNLYLSIYAMDFAENRLYARNSIPETERMTWTIYTGGRGRPLQIHFGSGGEPVIAGAHIDYKSWSSSTRFTMMVKLPASFFGKKSWQEGERVPFRATLASHSRAESMEWKWTFEMTQTGVESATKN